MQRSTPETNICLTFTLVKEESIKTFYEILSRLSSCQEEVLMDRTMRWWHVSTYSPKTGFSHDM